MGGRTPPLYLCKNWTEAKFKATLKSALRSATQYWPPINEKIKQVERKVDTGEKHKNGHKKYIVQHQCECCEQWFDRVKNRKGNWKPYVQVDHDLPLGGFSDNIHNWAKDLGEMYERAFVPIEGLTALCPDCHKIKTQQERETGAWKR